jgi:hypothetical protein
MMYFDPEDTIPFFIMRWYTITIEASIMVVQTKLPSG